MVPCLFLNPNWWDDIRLLSCIVGVSRLSSIFSRILDRIGRRLIGQHDALSSEFFFPGFAIIMICPTFH